MNKFSLFVFGIIKMFSLKMRLALKIVPGPASACSAPRLQLVKLVS